MPLKPLNRYAPPRYPTRDVVLMDPGALHQHLPPAWAAIPGTVLALMLNGCQAGESSNPNDHAAVLPQNGPSIVAPIFKHGEGRGAFGCVAVAAPVFLSEEEALAVISEELRAKGVELSVRNQKWKDAPIAPRHARLTIPAGKSQEDAWKDENGKQWSSVIEDTDKAKPLTVDGIDPAKHIAVEFIASDEAQQLGDYDELAKEIVKEDMPFDSQTLGCSVGTFDYANTAAHVNRTVQRLHGERVFFASFYDPVECFTYPQVTILPNATEKQQNDFWKNTQAKAEAEARARSLDKLRLQVRDFIAWLQAQGAI